MKLRGVWGSAVKFVSVAALLCGVVLWTVNTGAGKRDLVGGNKGRTAEVSRASKPATAQETQRWAAAYSKLPMSFEENQGQTAREVRYAARGGGYELFLTSQEAVMASALPRSSTFRRVTVRLIFEQSAICAVLDRRNRLRQSACTSRGRIPSRKFPGPTACPLA